MAEYRRIVESVSPGINVAALVGHNILRAGVIGYEGRTASAEELALMIERLEVSMEAGARGLSSGLIYPPGMYATEQEIHALATAVARQNGIYASHMRSEGRNLLESLSETIRVARSTGVRLQVSHLKTSGKANWHLIETAIEMLESVQCEGIQVAADRYPYTASCTELDVILPVWATEGGREAELHRLRDNQTRARIRQEILESRDPDSWSSITIGSTTRQNCRFRGLLLTEVSAALSLDPIDAALHLIETDQLSTTAFFHGMSEENMWRILSLPWVMLGTDASLRAPWGPLSQDFPHPRAYGSFTLFLKASLEGRTVPVTEAVRKMTSLPAAQFNLEDRGVIRRGAKADIAILDPAHLRAPASYGSPHQLSEGVTELLVNGVVQIQNGTLTGSRGGRWL